jgi:hypothetical protein
VSHRLWAEVERGERPNVSLATALRLLAEVGVSIRLTDPFGRTREIRDAESDLAARAARAAARRQMWKGRQTRLGLEGGDPARGVRGGRGVAAVSAVSERGYTIARARRPSR